MVDKGSATNAKGVIRFTSPTPETKQLVVDGVVDGLEAQKQFRIQIHECGDTSSGCESLGDMYGSRHMGTATADDGGRISFRYSDDQFAISDLIGRSVVIADEDKRYDDEDSFIIDTIISFPLLLQPRLWNNRPCSWDKPKLQEDLCL